MASWIWVNVGERTETVRKLEKSNFLHQTFIKVKEKNGRKRRKIKFMGIPMNKKIAEGEKLFGGSREGGRRKRIL